MRRRVSDIEKKRAGIRSVRGAQIPEFAASLVLLILVVFLPLLDLGIMPIRYFMSREIIEQFAKELSHAETLTQAYAELHDNAGLLAHLNQVGGVTSKNVDLHLDIHHVTDSHRSLEVGKPRSIPAFWLPDAKEGPYTYTLEVSATVEIAPAVVMGFDPKIPGLSAPVPIVIKVESPWENLSKNPLTKNYFLNE